MGKTAIGGSSPVSVQSMLNTRTTDVDACIRQINELTDAGCDLIRIAVPDEASAAAFGEIAKKTGLPLIADVHYSYKLAHLALDGGAKKIRMNPGNMRDFSEIGALARRMSDAGVPVRVGVNGGSLDPKFKGMKESDALVESALECANAFERCGMRDIVVAIKASDVRTMVEANRKLAAACDYPLHLGVTEAGTLRSGLVKSALGIGALFNEGIGDTVRISLSAPPVEEVLAGKTLLRSLGLKNDCVEVVSCPTCARTEIDVAKLADAVERAGHDGARQTASENRGYGLSSQRNRRRGECGPCRCGRKRKIHHSSGRQNRRTRPDRDLDAALYGNGGRLHRRVF